MSLTIAVADIGFNIDGTSGGEVSIAIRLANGLMWSSLWSMIPCIASWPSRPVPDEPTQTSPTVTRTTGSLPSISFGHHQCSRGCFSYCRTAETDNTKDLTAESTGLEMFTGTVESKSHEGGLLVNFEGSSPALNAIMVRADDGTYIGKVDGVIGSTSRPLAHVAHVDRALDMDALVGVAVTVRAKQKPREDRDGQRRGDRRQGGRNSRGQRNDRRGGDRGGQRWDDRRQSGRDNRAAGTTKGGDRRGRQPGITFSDDWTRKLPNVSIPNRCNRCGAPRRGGEVEEAARRSSRPAVETTAAPFSTNRRDRERGGDALETTKVGTEDDRRGTETMATAGRRQGGRGDDRRGGRPPQRRTSEGNFRRSKGKRPGHAHNRPPRDFRAPRRFERKDE